MQGELWEQVIAEDSLYEQIYSDESESIVQIRDGRASIRRRGRSKGRSGPPSPKARPEYCTNLKVGKSQFCIRFLGKKQTPHNMRKLSVKATELSWNGL
jgi:hypothetical protein